MKFYTLLGNLDVQGLIILNLVLIGIPLTIWLFSKIYKNN